MPPFLKARRAIVALIVTLPCLTSCDSLTSVSAPDVVLPESLESPTGALALRAGAQRNFAELMGFDQSIVQQSGILTDEIQTGLTGFLKALDARRERDLTQTSGSVGTWGRFGIARQTTLVAAAYLMKFQPTQLPRAGEMYALAGLVATLEGETYCSGATLSRGVNGQVIYGGSISTAQIFDSAIVHIDSALALSTDSVRLLNLARVAKGRTLLDKGQFEAAAAAVASVPTNYVYNAEFSTSAQLNLVMSDVSTSLQVGVGEREGGNGLDYRSANDPRVPAVFVVNSGDGTPLYRFTPYASRSAPIIVASGREARLIEAEAALKRNDVTGWLTTLNTLRGGFTPALASLTDPGTANGRVDLMFRERAFWLYLTAHRLGDMRRLISQYGRNAETVFPTGLYKDGLPFGVATYLAVGPDELRNPNFKGCDQAAP